MFGFRFFKSSPSQYIFQVRNGNVVREGAGLAFFYFAPQSSVLSVPLSAVDVPFMFEEITSDFQTVSLQGNMRYRIANPKAAIAQQDFSLHATGEYASEDPQKLSSKILNSVKAQFRTLLQKSDLRTVLQATDSLSKSAKQELSADANLAALGIEIGELNLLAAKPTPDTARALEASVRERILKEADDAIYERRNAAIEQERSVKENELRSELIIEEKKRLVRETQVETERAVLEKQQQLHAQELAGRVNLEKQNGELVQLQAENKKREADASAYALNATIQVVRDLDPRTLQALTMAHANPEMLMAMGFQNIADNAQKIGEFNFSPDLIRQLARKE